MDDANCRTWLNAACVGPSNSEGGSLDTRAAAKELSRDLSTCLEWVASWLRCDPWEVLLTSGTTEACDLALLLVPNRPVAFVHTDMAHRATEESVRCAAALHASVGARSTHVRTLPIADLLNGSSEELERRLCERLNVLCEGMPAVLVLEHVTSAEGARLPVERIAERLRKHTADIELIVDGAQAVGLWRPQDSLWGSYIGCFHKYVDGPLASGFAHIRGLIADRVPHHARAMLLAARGTDEGEMLPTCDIKRWSACARNLEQTSLLQKAPEHAACVDHLRAVLLRSLRKVGLQPVASREEYSSHILAVDFGSAERASVVWQQLCTAGFATKLEGRHVRVSLHHALDEQRVERFGGELQRVLACSSGTTGRRTASA